MTEKQLTTRDRPAPATTRLAVDLNPGRDLTVDLARAVAMVLVAVGHWLVVVPSYEDGRFDGVNALATVPLMGRLSWIFQVMPLFFAIGGFAGAASWRSARRRGTPYRAWLSARLVRLLRPTLVLLGIWTAALALLRVSGVDTELTGLLGWLVVVPVWFLAVYVILTAALPALLVAHERHGPAVVAVLVVGALVVDAGRLNGAPEAATYLNFFLVFALTQQFGFWWADGRVRHPRWWLVAGLGALWLLTQVGPYPTSMVGVPGERIANNAPPTICLAVLGVAQVGGAVAAKRLLARLLDRRPVQAVTLALNLHAMTILLWHFTALALTALVVLPLGVVPELADGTGAWWAVRVVSVVALAPVLAGLVALFGRFERAPRPPGGGAPVPGRALASGPWGTWRLLIATGLLGAGFAVVAIRGVSEASTPAGLPLLALALVGAGSGLVPWPGPSRRSAQAGGPP